MARRDRRLLTARARGGAAALAVVAVGACGEAPEVGAACRHMPAVVASVERVRALVEDPSSLSPGVARDVLVGASDALSVLAESPPRSISEDVGVLWAAHVALYAAWSESDWKGALARDTPAGSRAIALLGSARVGRAFERLDAFADDRCSVELGGPLAVPAGTPTTLPDAAPGDEQLRTDEGDSEDDALREALGFVLAERFGLAVTPDQAACLGGELLARSATPDADDTDAQYLVVLQETFDACRVSVDVAEVLSR